MSDNHHLSDLPSTTRLDLVLAVLSNMPTQESCGWSAADIAELAGCSEAAVHIRQKQALQKIKTKHPELEKEL